MPLENLIQRADLNQRLTRALEIKGQKSPVLQLDNVVAGVVIVEDLTKQAEWLTPTERKWASSVTLPAVAGVTNILAITNPLGSGVIGIIERIHALTVGSAQSFLYGLIDPLAVPANPASMFFRDRRNSGAVTVRAFSGTDAVSRVVNQYLGFQVSNAVATPWYETEGIVLQPGDTFGIQSTTVNVQTTMTIWGEEIPVA